MVDPVYRLTPHFGAKKEVFFIFWEEFWLKNLSFIFEFCLRYAMVTRKKIVLNLFWSQFLTHVWVEGDFLDGFLGCNRLTYTRVNTVLSLLSVYAF